MTQSHHFDTERLTVKNWSAELLDAKRQQILIDELTPMLTPAVLQHLPEPLQISPGRAAVGDWVLARQAESEVMTVRDQATSALLGILILAEFSEPDSGTVVHLGYLFAELAWGRGYATELLLGLVKWFGERDGQVQLLGGVERENVASARVLIKAGFTKVHRLSDGSAEMYSCVI
jgi:RimJ/RimL family protein N-acetyltransferase